MTAGAPRPMRFSLHPLPRDGGGERWHWAVYSHPDLELLRDGQTVGDGAKAERAARAAIAIMGGVVETPGPE